MSRERRNGNGKGREKENDERYREHRKHEKHWEPPARCELGFASGSRGAVSLDGEVMRIAKIGH
jgi:hypothetical protein